MMSAGQAVVECLRRERIDHLFCVPGESFLGVLNAAYDTPDLRLISARHEQGAAFMAAGYARATGRPGVVMGTRGVGAGNMALALLAANQDHVPLVAIIGQAPSGFLFREAVQEVDLVAYARPLTKWAVEVNRLERIPELVGRALRVSRSGRPGPVLVAIPGDLLSEGADFAFPAPLPAPRLGPDPAAVAAAVELLAGARRPGLLIGGDVTAAGANALVAEVAERLWAPVFQATPHLDLFPHSHPLWAGTIGYACNPASNRALASCDVLLSVGARLDDVTTAGFTLLPPSLRLIQVDLEVAALAVGAAAEVTVAADPGLALAALDDALRAAGALPPPERHAEVAAQRAAIEAERTVKVAAAPGWIHPAAVITALQARLPADALLVSDVGNFAGWFERLYQFERPDAFYFATASAMGYALPTAMGAALARPDRPVVAVAGDGGAMMTVQELETALRCQIPVVLIILNNNLYGTIRLTQERFYPGRPAGTVLTNPDFARLAQAFGAYGEQVSDPADLAGALDRVLNAGGPAVLEVLIDPDLIAVNQSLRAISPSLDHT